MVQVTARSKGDLGEIIALTEALRRGYRVAIPMGSDWASDLVVERDGKLERVQCKYVESDGEKMEVPCKTNFRTYTEDSIDWLVVYDKTTDRCYFLPASMLGKGRRSITLRLTPPKNGQTRGINTASDFLEW